MASNQSTRSFFFHPKILDTVRNYSRRDFASDLVVVALNMGEWSNFARLRRWPKSDALVFSSTFILTVIADITVAVEVGMGNFAKAPTVHRGPYDYSLPGAAKDFTPQNQA